MWSWREGIDEMLAGCMKKYEARAGVRPAPMQRELSGARAEQAAAPPFRENVIFS